MTGGQRAVSALHAGLTLRCPACGKGRLFSGYLRIPDHCGVCGADLARHDPGDGPAVFVILIVGFAVVAGALVVEVRYSPPYWLHAVLWGPAVIGLSLALLPVLRSLFFASHYHNDAGEGAGTSS